MKLSDHFYLQEFVPESIYLRFGNKATWFVDPRLVTIAEWIRTYFKTPITINNWHMGGNRQFSGFRPPECKVGAALSQHRYGRAMDIVIPKVPALQVQEVIQSNFVFLKSMGLTTMEAHTQTWTHLDVRQTGAGHLLLVHP